MSTDDRLTRALYAAEQADRRMAARPYPNDEGRTHWDGCWRERGHHKCAVAEADRLRAQLKGQKAGLAILEDALDPPLILAGDDATEVAAWFSGRIREARGALLLAPRHPDPYEDDYVSDTP